MRLGKRREQAIYDAVHRPLMDVRIEVAKLLRGDARWERIDELLFGAQSSSAAAAVRAATEGDMRKGRR